MFSIDFTGRSTDFVWIKFELDQLAEDKVFEKYNLKCYKNDLEVYNNVDGFIR
jgi:hypothetical protein